MEMSSIRHILSPFALELWLTVIVVIIMLTVLLMVTSYINIKYSYKRRHVMRHFSHQSSWHYVLGSFCQQGRLYIIQNFRGNRIQ